MSSRRTLGDNETVTRLGTHKVRVVIPCAEPMKLQQATADGNLPSAAISCRA